MGDTPEQTLDEFGVHQVSPNGEAPKTRSNGEDVTGVPPNEASSAAKPWWRDPTTIPPRQFLYDRHYVRRAIGATIAGGGRGKTTRAVYEAISMAIGRDLATREALPSGPLRVCMWNGEEDQDELDRRVAATCRHYGVSRADLGGRLFVISVRDHPMRIATLTKGAATLKKDVIAAMIEFITQNEIDVFMIDPFVSFHGLTENDNMQMDLVIKEGLGAIANRTNSAGEIFHHPGKPKPGQPETSVEDGRGASSIIWAVRSARVFNFMTPEEAAKFGMSEEERKLHVRIANGKANMGPLGKAKWMKFVIEVLPNGDEVACATAWSPPDPFFGITTADVHVARKLARGGAFRADSQSPEWFGYALAKHLELNIAPHRENDPKEISRIKFIIKTWLKTNVLEIEPRKDNNRKERSFIVPG